MGILYIEDDNGDIELFNEAFNPDDQSITVVSRIALPMQCAN